MKWLVSIVLVVMIALIGYGIAEEVDFSNYSDAELIYARIYSELAYYKRYWKGGIETNINSIDFNNNNGIKTFDNVTDDILIIFRAKVDCEFYKRFGYEASCELLYEFYSMMHDDFTGLEDYIKTYISKDNDNEEEIEEQHDNHDIDWALEPDYPATDKHASDNTSSSNKIRSWYDYGMGQYLPDPEDVLGKAIESDEFRYNMETGFYENIMNFSEADFISYRDACIRWGYDIEKETMGTMMFTAKNSDGYGLILYCVDESCLVTLDSNN